MSKNDLVDFKTGISLETVDNIAYVKLLSNFDDQMNVIRVDLIGDCVISLEFRTIFNTIDKDIAKYILHEKRMS